MTFDFVTGKKENGRGGSDSKVFSGVCSVLTPKTDSRLSWRPRLTTELLAY